MYCLKISRGFRFSKQKKHRKFTTLQNKYLVLIINKYQLLSTTFCLNIKKIIIEKEQSVEKKYNANVKNLIAKRSWKLNQSENSDRALRDDKSQHVHLGGNR